MNQTTSTKNRILAVSLSTRGFGYAVMEGESSFVDYGVKLITGDMKNIQSLGKMEKLINYYQPDMLVLQDVNAKGTHRAERIKTLHRNIIALARERKLKTVTFSRIQVRTALLHDSNGTKHDMATTLANQFPDELASRLPPKRKPWKSEDARMDIFEAVGLAVTFQKTTHLAL